MMSHFLMKQAPVRKGLAIARRLPRMLHRARANLALEPSFPPVLVNSIPKSGTHLLDQIVSALPDVRQFGTFWASTPSLTLRVRSSDKIGRMVRRVAPGELVRGHLYYNQDVAGALNAEQVVHYFIFRDPRDVVVSEAHYLADMNRWHRLHKAFRELPNREAQLRLAILGTQGALRESYPDIGTRFRRYAGWIGQPDVFSVRFEDLRGPGRDQVVGALVDYFLQRRNVISETRDEILSRCLGSIDPAKSHTFRTGASGGWRKEFTPDIKNEFKRVAGQLLIDLGYEKDLDW